MFNVIRCGNKENLTIIQKCETRSDAMKFIRGDIKNWVKARVELGHNCHRVATSAFDKTSDEICFWSVCKIK